MLRAVTVGVPIDSGPTTALRSDVRRLLHEVDARLTVAGIEARTTRFTLPSFGREAETPGVVANALGWADGLASELGVRWVCAPFDLMDGETRRERLLAALDAISRFPRTFINLIVAAEGQISTPAVNDAAAYVLNVSKKSRNGFDNFRVGVSANCPANVPFLPFSRHEGDALVLTFAMETIGTALAVADRLDIRREADLAAYRDALVDALVPELELVDELGRAIEASGLAVYGGLDASLAPFPDGRMSVGALVEQLLGASIGSQGSVFVTTFLTDALRAAINESGARAVGFNGVMYSVLEDEVLAAAVNRRQVDLDTLTALAAVCGCGLDMVPIAGTAFEEEIAAAMFDIAALSSTLAKPLGIRLLPIPNKAVNEFTEFNLDFLCDSRVVALSANDSRFHTGDRLLELRSPLRR